MKSKFKNVITGIIFAVGILISTAAVKADIQYVDLKTDDIYGRVFPNLNFLS